MPHRSSLLAVAFALTLAGCSGHPRGNQVQVTDSAGVRVVTNTSVSAPEWTLTADPLLDLGKVEGGGPEQFFQVVGARRLANGNLLVVNAGSREIRIFAPDGSFLRSFGRSGKGPGEFGFPGPPWRVHGDSLAFWDYRMQRLAVFDSAGSFGRFLALQQPIINPVPVAVLPDTRMVLRSDVLDMSSSTTFKMMDMDFFLIGPAGQVVDTLPTQPLGEFGQVGDESGGFVGSPLFSPQTQGTWAPDGYWVGTKMQEEVLRYSYSGQLTMVVRWPARDRTIAAGDADLEVERYLDGVPEDRRASMKKLYRQSPVAKQFPAYGLIWTDTLGDLWVQDYERPDHTGPSTWRVVDPGGALVGVVHVPEDDRLVDAGEDYLVTVHSDDVGVEHVRVYGLSRGQS